MLLEFFLKKALFFKKLGIIKLELGLLAILYRTLSYIYLYFSCHKANIKGPLVLDSLVSTGELAQ